MNQWLPIITGVAVALAVDYRKYRRAKKHNPNAQFDVVEAALTALIGVAGGGLFTGISHNVPQ